MIARDIFDDFNEGRRRRISQSGSATRYDLEVLRILSASLLDKTPIKELFTKEPEYVADDGQLILNFILLLSDKNRN